MLGQTKAIWASDNDWIVVSPCPFLNLGEFFNYVEIVKRKKATNSILNRLITLVVVPTREIDIEALNQKDFETICDTAIALNQSPEYPTLLNESIYDVKIPSCGNQYIDVYVQLLKVYPENARAIASQEGIVAINQLLWKSHALSKYDDYLELAQKEAMVKSQQEVAERLEKPEVKAVLKQILGK